jgi:hypothetical protein
MLSPNGFESFKKLNAEEFEKVVAKEIRNTNSLKMAEAIYMLRSKLMEKP